jgi:signal peptidase I
MRFKFLYSYRSGRSMSFPRRVTNTAVLGICVLLLLHVYGVEAFVVPTGSMAPALAGRHRAGICPRCGFRALVGRQGNDPDGHGTTCYLGAACPNCGCCLHMEQVPEATGDHILVNKSVFLFRRPRRWEIVVFRLLGKVFVKRVIGLPGEWILIDDGDIYINETLARKTLEEFKEIRLLVFDNNFQPGSEGWGQRWEYQAGEPGAETALGQPAFAVAKDLFLGGAASPHRYSWLTYQNFSLDQGKVQPLYDEYAYNGGDPPSEDTVHDFMVECDMEVERGTGQIGLSITDGQDGLMVEIPVGTDSPIRLLGPNDGSLPPREPHAGVLAQGRGGLVAGNSYHIELAFVDRRLTLTIDGEEFFPPCDLPPARERSPVSRPIALGVRGVDGAFHNVRLYRDLHYTQAGKQAVRGKAVLLGADQYFVMGDNSPNSEDSRFWPGHGVLPGSNLIGKPFLVHLPSRTVSTARFGRTWTYELPDWRRIRWLH